MIGQVHSVFEPLYQIRHHHYKTRYKVFYGGRYGTKSWNIAYALLIRGRNKKLRILCTREIQKSIRDSVHKLLCDKIYELKLDNFYTITDTSIKGKNGTEFLFAGLWNNIDNIKSMESIDIVWIEEGQSISKKSCIVLFPTIIGRKPNAEIWISMNPDDEEDYIYAEFIAKHYPNSYVKEINYNNNPHLSPDALEEINIMKKDNYSLYLHVYEGEPYRDYEANVFYRFDRKKNLSEKEIPYMRGLKTFTCWDFGINPSDTAIGFFQEMKLAPTNDNPRGLSIRLFDEYVNNNKDYKHYRDVVDAKNYIIDVHYCDPSGITRSHDLSSWVDKLSFNEKKGINDWFFEWRHDLSPAEMIDHSNDYMPYLTMNRHQTPHFYNAFRKWQYRTDKDGTVVKPPKPNHDEYSHPGTAWNYGMCNKYEIQTQSKKAVLK